MRTDEECAALWGDISLTTGIPFWIADLSGRELYAFPEDLRNILVPDFFPFGVSKLEKHEIGREVMVFYLTDSWYLIFCRVDETRWMISAPLPVEGHAPLPFNFIQHFVLQEHKAYFISLLTALAAKQIYTAARAAGLVRWVSAGEGISDVRIRDIMPGRLHEAPAGKERTDIREMAAVLPKTANQSSYVEERVCGAVRRGDYQEFLRACSMPVSVEYGRMSSDPLRQQKYLFIIRMQSLTRTVLECGVTPEIVFHTSDMYCMKMDGMNSAAGIGELLLASGRDFCALVREAKGLPDQSPEVAACCDYIFRHIYDPVRLEDLEQAVHMNRRSLTIHFKEEMGLTIPEYVLSKKLEEADFLLKASSFSILEISTLLSFSSESHFIQQYRKNRGITPRQYRRGSIHHEMG